MNVVINEVKLTWNLLQSNLLVGFVPIIIFSITAWYLIGHSVDTLPHTLAFAFLFGFPYLYSFDITQQILSISEDKINKPNRPLVSGQLSISGACVRCVISHIAFFTFSDAPFDIMTNFSGLYLFDYF